MVAVAESLWSAELDLGINDLYPLFLMFLRSSHTFVGKETLSIALIELWLECSSSRNLTPAFVEALKA